MRNQVLYEMKEPRDQKETLSALESGKVVFLPKTPFEIHDNEQAIFDPNVMCKGRKNVSYDICKQSLLGVAEERQQMLMMFLMERYAIFARHLVDQLFPFYQNKIRYGRTSFRPTEIWGRQQSILKDDTRLHVDAFVATPVKGDRILRVFSNINRTDPRIWNLGESFEAVLDHFFKKIPAYSRIRAYGLYALKITKTLRTPYDHYMLMLHNQMKRSHEYQRQTIPFEMAFPAQSTWVVFTDQASHAALKGQYVLEQTFYLPVEAMFDPMRSPLKQWEKKLNSSTIRPCSLSQ